MSDVKIGVVANAGTAKAAVDVMTNAVNGLAKSVAQANNTPYQAPGLDKASKDLAKLQKQFQQAIAMSAALRNAISKSGQNGNAGILNINWDKLAVDPKVAQRLRDRAFTYAARGTAWDNTNVPKPPTPPGGNPNAGQPDNSGSGGRGGRGRGGRGRGGGGGGDDNDPPDDDERGGRRSFWSFGRRAASSLTSGFGGPVDQIARGGIDGAASGAAEGGIAGGAAGLLAGAGIATLLAGLFAAGKSVSEGYELAKQHDLGLDTLKRQMGDLGVSFEALRDTSEAASEGLGINAVQATELARQSIEASHGAAGRSPLEVMSSVQESTGFARSYGLDPSQAVSLFGSMRQMDPRQSQRELALFIADAIARTGGRAMPTDVMQAVQGLTAAASRMSLVAPDASRVAGAYASLVTEHGMTAENATSILGTANAAVSNMGGAGEAGQYFMMAALNHEGGPQMNYLEAKALSAGGLFATRAETFGKDTELGKAMAGDKEFESLATGPGSDVTNFEALRKELKSAYGDNRLLMLDAAQHEFGVSTLEQASALMNMSSDDAGGLTRAMKQANVAPADVNASGLQTIAQIGKATSLKQLDAVYSDMASRTGDGALTDGDRDTLDKAEKSGNLEEFRSALVKVAASRDQQETVGSDIRKGNASLQNIEMDIGQHLVPAMNASRDALLALAGVNGKSATPEELRERALKSESDTSVAAFKAQRDGVAKDANDKIAALQKKLAHLGDKRAPHAAGDAAADAPTAMDPETDKQAARIRQQIADLMAQRDAATAPLDTGIAAEQGSKTDKLKYLSQLEKQYGLPPGLLDGIWRRESSEGKNTKRNSYGAEGNFQQIDDVVEQYGIHRGSFTSEALGAARQLHDLQKKEHGDWFKAVTDYSGSRNKPEFAKAYFADVTRGVPGYDPSGADAKPEHADKNAVKHEDLASEPAPKKAPSMKLDDGATALSDDMSVVDLASERAPQKAPPLHLDDGAKKLDDSDIGLVDLAAEKGSSKIPASARPNTPATTETVERQADGTQMVVLDIGVNVASSNASGQKTVSTTSTVVGVPRGNGIQRVSLTAQ